MIVIGYQGIGKSTLAGRDNRFIDLESGSFWVDGKRADDWYRVYCQVAEHLSEQGYVVFTSSHKVVCDQLVNTVEDIVIVYPALELKDAWVDKLEKRYEETGLEKDYKALMNAKERFDENIKALEGYDLNGLRLKDMSYDLEAILIAYRNGIRRMS